jgi:hypothetical protein
MRIMTSPLQSPEDVVEWIDACVLGDLRTLILGIDAYYAVITGAGSEASDPHLSPLPGLAADSLLLNGRHFSMMRP